MGTLAPARLLDTRQPNSTVDGLHAGGGPAPAGSVVEVQITGRGGVPPDAIAAILNVTVVGAQADGFATVFDCAATVPTASNVNYTTGRDIPNNTVSKLSPSGTVCIYTDADGAPAASTSTGMPRDGAPPARRRASTVRQSLGECPPRRRARRGARDHIVNGRVTDNSPGSSECLDTSSHVDPDAGDRRRRARSRRRERHPSPRSSVHRQHGGSRVVRRSCRSPSRTSPTGRRPSS